jgi:tryptophan synthase alpha chain
VSTPSQARQLRQLADGVIAGSAVVNLIAQWGAQATAPLEGYVASMVAALHQGEAD